MAPHPLLPSEIVEPPNTGAKKLLSPLAIADARALADRHNFLRTSRVPWNLGDGPGVVQAAS